VRDISILVLGFLDLPDRLEEGFLDFEDLGFLTTVIVDICDRDRSSG